MPNATPDTQSLPHLCDRYPCDTAYQRGVHWPSDGRVHHAASVGPRMRDDLSGYRWSVDVVAVASEPWAVSVRVDAGEVLGPDEAEELGAAIHRANVWALKANLKEGQRA